jgi:hypothetical protein
MGYFMRFIVTDSKPVSAGEMSRALKNADPAYSMNGRGELMYRDALFGKLTIDTPDGELFEEELDDLLEELAAAGGDGRDAQGRAAIAKVRGVLDSAKATVAVQVLFQNRETEEILSRLAPLWAYLFAHREGLLQVDGEGYYDAAGEVLGTP